MKEFEGLLFMNIVVMISKYNFYITLVFVLIIIIIVIVNCIKELRKDKAGKDDSLDYYYESGYKNRILKELPYDDRLDYTNISNRLESINDSFEKNRSLLEQGQFEAIESIQLKLKCSKDLINNHWRKQKKKRNFYECIYLHYASFCLADSIKREQENIRDAFVKSKLKCEELREEINNLNEKIPKTHGSYRYKLKQQHKKLCTQHKRLSRLKNVFGKRNKQYLDMVKEQNIITRKYRDYISVNFGVKGRQWRDGLRKNKTSKKYRADLLSEKRNRNQKN